MATKALTHHRVTREVDRQQLRRRFYGINRERLQRLRETLRPRQRQFLDLLPLLFHTNHPLLPGFVSKRTPFGISDYSPAKRSVEAARQLTRSFHYQKRALPTYQIHALYLMGSSGTIAYSENSDFDVWVCHQPGLSREQRNELRRKTERISAWARAIELEVHFFVMDAECFRAGGEEALSTESSGKIQHQLLLDEFYRTGLLLAGRYPIWWLVPTEAEGHYDDYVRELRRCRFVRTGEDIDLGGLAQVPAGEFLGASLWQLYKAIDSPYKSLLKILLMEVYASEYPRVDLLSLRFKRAVYDGETDLDRLDPYVMLEAKVEEYLTACGEHERLGLARRCFYFKVGERLSEPELPAHTSHRREVMRALTREWGWKSVDLHVLDARASWKVHRVLDERRILVDQLTRSYRMLSDFAREHWHTASIDPLDLNTLGRKLYASFERKAGKVEIINPGISRSLAEERLGIVQKESEGEQQKWLLFRDEVDEEDTRREAPLKRAYGLVELLAWCYFNRLMNQGTVLGLHTRDCGVSYGELHGILDCLQRNFPDARLGDARLEELAHPPKVLQALLFINLGVDPMAQLTRHGMHLTSNRTDALCYGGRWENLALSFDLVVLTSWQEVLTFRYTGPDALPDCLCDYLAWAPQGGGGGAVPRVPAAYSFSSTRGPLIAQRIEGLFQDVINCFYGLHKSDAARFVLRVAHRYYLLEPENRSPRYRQVVSLDGLLTRLAEPREDFSPVILDAQALRETPFPLIFEANRPAVVQFFYHVSGERVEVYIIDERASLFHQSLPFYDETALLGQFQRFLESVRHRHAPQPGGGEAARDAIEYYRLEKRGPELWRAEPARIVRPAPGCNYFDVQVIAHSVGRRTDYTLYCDHREFSSLQYGEDLYAEFTRHILLRREGGERYPIYITDIDVSRGLLGADTQGGMQTIHYLNYKKRIEERLNRTLEHIDPGPVD